MHYIQLADDLITYLLLNVWIVWVQVPLYSFCPPVYTL